MAVSNPFGLDTLSPEERHQIYTTLWLAVEVSPDGFLDVTGVLGDGFVSENQDELLGSDIQTLKTPQLMFRALLTKECTPRLELQSSLRPGTRTYALSDACSYGTATYRGWPYCPPSLAAVQPI
jgi:hypothetical protein